MKRIKQWFHDFVMTEVHKCMDEILHACKRIIEDHIIGIFQVERDRLAADLEVAKRDLKAAIADMHEDALGHLGDKVLETLDIELKAFEARVQHTLTACIKDEPSHWRADEDTKQSDKAHQQPQR